MSQETTRGAWRTAFSYSLGSLGNNIIFAFISTYLLIFYTDVFGISAASVAILFLVARIWDGINDPIMGMIVDNTHTRWGKFRPYLFFVPIIMGLATVACFLNPNLSDQGKLIYAYVTYIAWGMSFTAMDIPYWSMTASITRDMDTRSKVITVSRTMAFVGFLVANVITLPLTSQIGWGLTALVFSISSLLLTWFTFFTVKENYTVPRKEKQSFKGAIELFRVNKPLRMIIYNLLIFDLIDKFRFSFSVFYLKYNIGADELMISVFMGLYLIFMIAGSILSPFISRKLGKKRTAILGYVLNIISGIGMFATGYDSLVLMLAWASVGSIGTGMANIATMTMLTDTVEYGQYKTGHRSEGMIFSANIFRVKVASAIGGALGAYALSRIGYVPNVVQSQAVLTQMHWIFTLIPGVLYSLCIIPLFFYGLTEERYAEIVEALANQEEVAV